MGAVRIVILAAAAVVAVVLALVVGSMLKQKPPAVVAQAAVKPMTRVVVAAHDLPIGTRLAPGDLTWQSWPVDSINPTFITDGSAAVPPPGGVSAVAAQTKTVATTVGGALTGQHGPMDELVGAIVRQPILANEPVVNAKLVRGGEGGFLSVVLRPGMRAISVPATVNTAAGGFILPGDHVDVVQARPVEGSVGGFWLTKPYIAHTLVRNVRVLAIDQTSDQPKNATTVIGAVATLEVPADDTEMITKARAEGEVTLVLRPFAEGRNGADTPETEGGDLKTVHILRDGQASDVVVSE